MAKRKVSNYTDKHLTEKNVVFSDGDALPANSYQLKDRYAVFFSNYKLNLSSYVAENDRIVVVNTVFGNHTLLVPKDLNFKIQASTVFGSVKVPGRKSSSFGEDEYYSPAFTPDQPLLTIKANVIFGNLKVRFI